VVHNFDNGFCRFTNVGKVDCCDCIRIRYWRREAKLERSPSVTISYTMISDVVSRRKTVNACLFGLDIIDDDTRELIKHVFVTVAFYLNKRL